jgi:hypothetical protein
MTTDTANTAAEKAKSAFDATKATVHDAARTATQKIHDAKVCIAAPSFS